MDQKFHFSSQVPGDIKKVIMDGSSSKLFKALIFEPMDLVPFEIAWAWQKEWQQKLLAGQEELPAIWILQHSCCYTLGRGATESNLLFHPNNPPSSIYRIDRGGEVTHHLPGQLVVYPVIDLRSYRKDLNWYLRELEQVLIDVLAVLGLKGERQHGFTGVWCQGCKVAAIGVGCKRWITQHGLSLNVDCELDGFKEIIPCGEKSHKIGRLNSWLPGLKILDVQPLIKNCFSKRFNLLWME